MKRRNICLITLVASLVALPAECFVGFGLWFAPGWSVGWGLPKHVVWFCGLALALFLILVTIIIILATVVLLGAESFRKGNQQGRSER